MGVWTVEGRKGAPYHVARVMQASTRALGEVQLDGLAAAGADGDGAGGGLTGLDGLRGGGRNGDGQEAEEKEAHSRGRLLTFWALNRWCLKVKES